VTGVLPVALEEANKVTQALLKAGKEYVCVMRLHSFVSEKRVTEVIKEFEGKIFQRPPVRSSVKRQVRVRTIYYIEILEINDRNGIFKVGCEAGTYIRKLAHDIGDVLKCGAHMHELRRIRSGPFTEDTDSVTLHDVHYLVNKWREEGDERLLRRFLLPMERALDLTPKLFIKDSAVDAVCHGAHLAAPGVVSLEKGIIKKSKVALFTLKGEAVALGTSIKKSNNILNMDHGIVVLTNRVLMPRGTYPKLWRSQNQSKY
jgi:H/ACA ribonucleoprotein complex subunit 4